MSPSSNCAHSLGRALMLGSLLASLGAGVHAQLGTPSVPASRRAQLSLDVPVVVGAHPDLERYRAEDFEQAGKIAPYRYGAVIAIDAGIDAQGRWDVLEDSGELVWRVEIASPGAYTLGLLFDEFEVPEGGEVFVYSKNGAILLGAFTSANEQANGMLGIQPVIGDRIIVEYVHPSSAVGEPRLHIESVVHDYRDVFAVSSALSQSPAPQLRGPGCLIDVNCPQGAPYQDIKRSVIGLLRGGFVCSGSILNNSANDATPYMYTANHCGSFTNGTFVFNYERPGCDSGAANLNQTLSGATLLAADSLIDSQLYRLNQAPPASYTPYYAGWSVGKKQQPSAVGISHPAGLPKKIQLAPSGLMSSTDSWFLLWTQGEIQGGSSGSPLFNANGRVLGPLCCGSAGCGGSLASYGKMGRFMQRRPNVLNRLDPLGTVGSGIDGYDPFAAAAVSYNGTGLNPAVYVAGLPVLNSTWTAAIDVSGHAGASSTVILGYVGQSTGNILGVGELLVDLSSAFVFQSDAVVAGTTSSHSASIPNDPALSGAVAYTQAIILGGGAELTNGVILTLN